MSKYTHCGFSDESSWNQGRYRSVSLVTGSVDDLGAMERALDEALKEWGIQEELKWQGLKGSQKVQAAIQVLRIAADYAAMRKCRVDTLIWDAEDARHKVRGRDDLENLARMYYHILRNVTQKRWPNGASWLLLPDEHHAIDWDILERCLDAVSKKFHPQFHFPDAARFRYRKEFNIEKVKPVKSNEYRLTQLADLFAGVSVFSWRQHSEFRLWQDEQSGQQSLFGNARCTASNSSRSRFPVLLELIRVCHQKKFGLSNEPGGLQTLAYNANNQITFWFYRPQGDYDKAPVKDKVRGKAGR